MPPQPSEGPLANLRNAAQALLFAIEEAQEVRGVGRAIVLPVAEGRAILLRVTTAIAQLERGMAPEHGQYRRNPDLLIFNPPARRDPFRHARQGRVLSEEAHELRYRHAEDGKLYRHPFETDVTVRAIVGPKGAHDILLASPHGLNLWEDF